LTKQNKRCFDIFDDNAAKEIFNEYRSLPKIGHKAVEINYEDDTRFSDGLVIESRISVRNRFYKYLSHLFASMKLGKVHDCIIHASHYEVLHNLSESLFAIKAKGEDTLSHGEIIEMNIFDENKEDSFSFVANFRNRTTSGEVFYSDSSVNFLLN